MFTLVERRDDRENLESGKCKGWDDCKQVTID